MKKNKYTPEYTPKFDASLVFNGQAYSATRARWGAYMTGGIW